MDNLNEVFQAIAIAVQQQLAEEYPVEKDETIYISVQEMTDKLSDNGSETTADNCTSN